MTCDEGGLYTYNILDKTVYILTYDMIFDCEKHILAHRKHYYTYPLIDPKNNTNKK